MSSYVLNRLSIGSRLTLCFVLIILTLLAGNGIALWQFNLAWTQAERLRGVDEELIAVMHAHRNLRSFYDRLEVLASSEDAERLLKGTEALRQDLLEDSRNTRTAFERLPPEVQPHPTLQTALQTVQQALPSQLEAIARLAKVGEWEAVRLRLANEVRPLESRISLLVQDIDREVSLERAHAIVTIEQAQRTGLLFLPVTAVLTLLSAALLGWAITRSITRPLGLVMEASESLGRGEFHHQVSVVGSDELARLGQAFNDASRKLKDNYEALHSKEADLAEVQRLSHTGSFGWNPAKGGLVWSDETFRIFEYDPLMRPTREMVLARTHPEDVALLAQVLDPAASAREWDLEYRLVMPSGSVKYVRLVTHVIRDPGGKPGFVGAILDITRSKRAEEALRHAQATLAQVTRVTTLGEMAASIAHEVNQPLAATITNSNTCIRWLARTPPDLQEAREAAARSAKDALRAAEIIKRIRALFKQGPAQREPTDVNELIRAMLALHRHEVESNSAAVRLDLAADLPTVAADPVQLQQVVLNLMRNGLEAMRDSALGGELRIETRQADDGHLLVCVSDTGVGVTPEQAGRIFDAFFTTKPEGIGMGLAISRSIVESHGGRLWVAPNASRGATFCFTLPSQWETPR
ncbi:MAG TPA: ATP-binding protein [Bryobacteraceae bacterium]|nr:ATP-binding protein [Bryobacteraceae bacterium]